ncbi:GNAT family N-acetyltransferase [Belnapia rosea]|uniref:hypothetical protein n=1 Tax=Belnapia rosea TaxID=938405 RepID=UPI000881A334|nr:hypothetical protein [Belnapia rosea]SDB72819.1 hypothetical protein SAMN02927895_04560 [Belnapia rosea]
MIGLRPASPADAPALVAIHRAGLDAARPGLASPWTEAKTLAWFAGELPGTLALEGDRVPGLIVTPTLHRRGTGAMTTETAKAAAPGCLRLACFRRTGPRSPSIGGAATGPSPAATPRPMRQGSRT